MARSSSRRLVWCIRIDARIWLTINADLTPANKAFIRDQIARLRQIIRNPDLDNQFFESLVEHRGSKWLENVLVIKAEIQKGAERKGGGGEEGRGIGRVSR